MRLRALLAGVALALGPVAACSDDDGGITVRPDADTTDPAATTADGTTTTTVATTADDDDGTTTTTGDDDGTTTTTDDDGTTTTDAGGPAGTYPAAIRQLFIQAFVGQGLSQTEAECVVDVVEERVPFEDLAAGDISAVTEDQAELGRAILERCEIDLNSLGAPTTG